MEVRENTAQPSPDASNDDEDKADDLMNNIEQRLEVDALVKEEEEDHQDEGHSISVMGDRVQQEESETGNDASAVHQLVKRDDAEDSDEDQIEKAKLQKQISEDVALTFPQRLMEILGDEANADVIGWLPHGRAFMVYRREEFESEVLPKYFQKQSKYSSFTRKLNRWGFVRATRGPETGAYFHPLFKQGEHRLCMQMNCHSANKINKASHHSGSAMSQHHHGASPPHHAHPGHHPFMHPHSYYNPMVAMPTHEDLYPMMQPASRHQDVPYVPPYPQAHLHHQLAQQQQWMPPHDPMAMQQMHSAVAQPMMRHDRPDYNLPEPGGRGSEIASRMANPYYAGGGGGGYDYPPRDDGSGYLQQPPPPSLHHSHHHHRHHEEAEMGKAPSPHVSPYNYGSGDPRDEAS